MPFEHVIFWNAPDPISSPWIENVCIGLMKCNFPFAHLQLRDHVYPFKRHRHKWDVMCILLIFQYYRETLSNQTIHYLPRKICSKNSIVKYIYPTNMAQSEVSHSCYKRVPRINTFFSWSRLRKTTVNQSNVLPNQSNDFSHIKSFKTYRLITPVRGQTYPVSKKALLVFTFWLHLGNQVRPFNMDLEHELWTQS